MPSHIHHTQNVQGHSRSPLQHARLESTNEKLNSFKEKLDQSLNSSSSKIKPGDLEKHIAELPDNNEKLGFLRFALQTGVDAKGPLLNHHKQGFAKHMQLVSWALKQIAGLGSSVEVSRSISTIDLSKAPDQMIEHLNFTRRFIELYPDSNRLNASSSSHKKIFNYFKSKEKSHITSKLQSALSRVFDSPTSENLSKANRLLTNSQSRMLMQHKSIFKSDAAKAWVVANEKGNFDLQRAILLLRPESLVALSTDSRKTTTDSTIKAVLKELPYFVRQGVEGSHGNFNSEATFLDDASKQIVCRHLATHRIETQAMNENGKFRVDDNKPIFTDLSAVQQNIHGSIEQKFDRLGVNAEKNYLINNKNFGSTLVQLFKEMDDKITKAAGNQLEEKMQSVQYIALCSENHVMSLKLHIKTTSKSQDVKKYVVEFYDPNLTNNHVRLARFQLNSLAKFHLKDMFVGGMDVLYNAYYPENNETSILYVTGTAERTRQILNLEIKASASKNRKLDNQLDVESITPKIMSHLLRDGFAENLIELAPRIKATKSGNELLELLEAKNSRGIPGLHFALLHGHADVINAYKSLLSGVPNEHLVSLLESKSVDGFSGLYFALVLGNAKAVEAYGSLLEGLSNEDRVGLLQAKGIDDFSGLNSALALGMANSIKAFGTLLINLPEKDRIQLLEARSPQGVPGIHFALSCGYANAVQALGKLIQEQDFSAEGRLQLFESFNSDSRRVAALKAGHEQAVQAYDQLLNQLSA